MELRQASSGAVQRRATAYVLPASEGDRVPLQSPTVTHHEFVAGEKALCIRMVAMLFGRELLKLGNALRTELHGQGKAFAGEGRCRHRVFHNLDMRFQIGKQAHRV